MALMWRINLFLAYHLSPLILGLYKSLIPKAVRTKPMRVLCLGPARSGTESLHDALQYHLNYNNVSHGFVWWYRYINTSLVLYGLAGKKLRGNRLTADELDLAFADFDGITDVPGIWFAEELLDAYPDAKVVLNRRKDMHKWKESFRGSVLPMIESWSYFCTSWFQWSLFWGVNLTNLCWMGMYFRGKFEDNAVPSIEAHWYNIEKKLRSTGRPALEWSVEDGWEPLCRFLGKNVPEQEFPSGNTANLFLPKLLEVDTERMREAKRNAAALLSVLVLVVLMKLW